MSLSPSQPTPHNIHQFHPPPQPTYILRGHTAQIHSISFFRRNHRLISGDADGWIIIWNVSIKRPVAVWRAHGAAVLGVGTWGEERILTHGRDNKLLVWLLRETDEAGLSRVLPIEDAVSERKKPWLLHSLDVNALNFCSFAIYPRRTGILEESSSNPQTQTENLTIAVPGYDDGYINLTHLPSETRKATIPSPQGLKTGLLMAVDLHASTETDSITVLAGYESGHVCIWKQTAPSTYQPIYLHQTHQQPVLSLCVAPTLGCFFTSSADALLARHALGAEQSSPDVVQTRHAGQQALRVRGDERIFATAGWDGRARVYAAKSMKELAVLKWHKEGCYALAFGDVIDSDENSTQPNTAGTGDVVKRELTVSQRRVAMTAKTHWLAAGSKDGKVSLWDIY